MGYIDNPVIHRCIAFEANNIHVDRYDVRSNSTFYETINGLLIVHKGFRLVKIYVITELGTEIDLL